MGAFVNDAFLNALAQAAQTTGGAAGQPQQPSVWMSILPLLLLFVVFYFLMIRPQQKRQREHQEMIARLKKGDQVVTGGGLIGTIVSLTDREAQIEVADKVKVTVLRHQVALYSSANSSEALAGEAKKDN